MRFYFVYLRLDWLWSLNLFALILLNFLEKPLWCQKYAQHACDQRDLYFLGQLPYLSRIESFIYEGLTLVILVLVIFYPLSYEGLNLFWKSSMNKLKVLLLFILACDILVFAFSPQPFRVAPYIRVVFLIMTIRELRMCAVTLFGMVGTYLNVLALSLLFLLFASWLAYVTFEDTPQGKTIFSSYGATLYQMFVLFTTSNNPDVWVPAYKSSRWYSLFFVIYVLLGVYFLTNLILAVIYDSFKEQLAKQLAQVDSIRKSVLEKAFDLIDTSRRGYLNKEQCISLLDEMNKYRSLPKTSMEDFELIFAELDRSGDFKVTSEEFADLCNAIAIQFQREPPPSYLEKYPSFYHSPLCERLKSFVRSHLFEYIVVSVLLMNLVAVIIETTDLELPFSEQEVWDTIKEMPSDKAPGLDGFTGCFFKSCWHIIKEDISAALVAVQLGDFRHLRLLNSAYLTLIPKKEDTDQVKDFRPISLIHSFAKLVTKILANRLAGRLHEIVASNQSVFIKGRCIQDNFMLVQQTAKFLNQQKAPRILLKLDISKAFDSISWPFLLEVLRYRGFGPIWRNLICGLLNASSTRVLLNGIPGEEIQHQRGLRQGDPLSPMLFILVMDVLNATIQKASDEGLLQPLANRPLKHRVSLYADDVVLFLRPVASDLELISAVLQLFGTASGLKTNIQKSSASPIQCSDEDIAIIQQHMSCVVQDFPSKYLGLPLSFKNLTKGQVQPIIDRIAAHLPGWKSDLMNRAGRLVMVQFVMTSMVIYLAIASDLPPWAIKEIDKIRRSFLWRGRREANGGHCLLTWPRVSRPKELGGLGIHDLKSLGWALRMRWLWLAKTQPDRPWAEFKIMLHPSVHAFFSMAVFTVVGDGKSTLFWTDKWLHGQSIELLAPHLFALVYKRTAKRRTVFDALLDNYWIRDLRGALIMAALSDYFDVWNLVSDVQLQPDLAYVHNWRLTASGQYSAKSAYNALFFGSVQFDPWKLIWNTWAPKKCQFFLWLAFHNRCWTADRLAKRGLPHPAQCPLCDQEDETIQHILCGCVVARQIWSLVFRRYGLPDFSPLPDDKVLHVWWMRILDLFPDNCKRGLNSLIILVAWSLWKHRNDIVFNGAALNVQRILKQICEEANLWCLAGASGLAHLEVAAR